MSEPIGPEQVHALTASDEVAADQTTASHATVATDQVPGADPPPASPTHADPRVADALSRLGEIDQLPLAEQVEVFGDIHRRLAAVLADPDSQAQ